MAKKPSHATVPFSRIVGTKATVYHQLNKGSQTYFGNSCVCQIIKLWAAGVMCYVCVTMDQVYSVNMRV